MKYEVITLAGRTLEVKTENGQLVGIREKTHKGWFKRMSDKVAVKLVTEHLAK